MGLGDAVIGDETIGTDQVDPWVGLRYWVYVDNALMGDVKMDSLQIEEDESGNIRASCTVLNPQVPIAAGNRLEIVNEDTVEFGGVIRTLEVEPDLSGAVQAVHIEAEGWDFILRRRFISKRYTNARAGDILVDALSVSQVSTDQITAGLIDRGPNIILADAVNQRMSEFVRDVASAGGGFAFVDANRRLTFRSTSLPYSSLALTADRAETLLYTDDLDNYRNRQIVKVTGLDGTTTVTETRDDLAEQAERAADEGGSGIYEMYEEVRHTTSSVVGDLSIMGQTVGYLALRTYGRNVKRLRLRMRAPAVRVREIVQVDVPSLGLLGPFSTISRRITDLAGELLYEIELIEGGVSQDALETLLKIVGAARTTVSIDASLFPNAQSYTVPGTYPFVVPEGVKVLQMTCIGGSAGGGGGARSQSNSGGPLIVTHADGGRGGDSSLAFTILANVSAGQTFDITVGAKGLAGVSVNCGPTFSFCEAIGTDGTSGTVSKIERLSVVYCQSDPGLLGTGAYANTSRVKLNGVDGANGGGIGDSVTVSGGMSGGMRGTGNIPSFAQPTNGKDGLVEIRW